MQFDRLREENKFKHHTSIGIVHVCIRPWIVLPTCFIHIWYVWKNILTNATKLLLWTTIQQSTCWISCILGPSPCHHAMSGMAAMWFWSLDTSLLSGFGSGACLVSFYLRVGGGIFSKGAELGPLDHGKGNTWDSCFFICAKNIA